MEKIYKAFDEELRKCETDTTLINTKINRLTSALESIAEIEKVMTDLSGNMSTTKSNTRINNIRKSVNKEHDRILAEIKTLEDELLKVQSLRKALDASLTASKWVTLYDHEYRTSQLLSVTSSSSSIYRRGLGQNSALSVNDDEVDPFACEDDLQEGSPNISLDFFGLDDDLEAPAKVEIDAFDCDELELSSADDVDPFATDDDLQVEQPKRSMLSIFEYKRH